MYALILLLIAVLGTLALYLYSKLPPKISNSLKEILQTLNKGAKAYPYLVSFLKVFDIDLSKGWEDAFTQLKNVLAKHNIQLTDEEWDNIAIELKKQWYKIYKEITGQDWEEPENPPNG